MQKLRYLLLVSVAACAGSSGPADLQSPERVPTDLQILFNGIDFGGKTLNTGATAELRFTSRVLDAAGLEMTTPTPVQFVSRDTSKAVVDAAGVITARVPGSALIVARLASGNRELTDSVSVSFFCTADFRYGLNVELKDSVTGAIPSVASNWRSRDVAGTFADSGRTTGFFYSAGERAGTYRIDISTPGYRDWTADGVVVTRDQCHVKGVALTARLQRAP